ncbi:hypothetical protein [Streptomyces sp. NBC_00353]|uniref:hypothetical protein n=1 Tax=Streptomyces sp. NBC_00353 TaxID=2975722 RepID=UPI002E25BC33
MTAASPTAPLPRTSRKVQLLAVPGGLPRPEHFRVVRTPLPQPAEGEMLVRNRYFLVFPGLRTVVGGRLEGAIFPGAQPGDPLCGTAVAEVVAAASGAGGAAGGRAGVAPARPTGVRRGAGGRVHPARRYATRSGGPSYATRVVNSLCPPSKSSSAGVNAGPAAVDNT